MTTPLPPEASPTPVVVPGAAPTSVTATTVPNVVIAQPQQYFTAEDLEKARQQEKDKLYARLQAADETQKRMDAFQTDMDQWKAERDAEKERLKAEQDAAAELARKAEEEKLSVADLLAKRDAEWQAEKESLRTQMETERVIAQKDRELFQLQAYIQRRVAEEVAQDNVAPEFLDYIDGLNETEVEAAITKAKEKTASIVAGMGGQGSPVLTPGVSPAGFAPSGPLDNITGQRTYTLEQIKAMPSNSEEYRQFRARVGIDKAGNNQGLFN